MKAPQLADALETVCEALDIDTRTAVAAATEQGSADPALTVPEAILVALAALVCGGADRDVHNRYQGSHACSPFV